MAGSSCIFCSSMRLTSISLLWFKRTNVRIKTNFHQEIGPTTTKYAFWLVSFVVSDRKLLILQQHNGIIKIASSSPQNYEILSNLFVWEARKLWRQILVAKMFISLMWINLLDGRSISDSHCEENRLAFRRLSAHVQHEKTRSARVLGAKRQSFEEKRRRKKKAKKAKEGAKKLGVTENIFVRCHSFFPCVWLLVIIWCDGSEWSSSHRLKLHREERAGEFDETLTRRPVRLHLHENHSMKNNKNKNETPHRYLTDLSDKSHVL